MRETNLSSLDLNLLPALEALLRRRNVTAAGADVGLSQPAASRALARLRAIFDDPLLARGARGLVLTPLALSLQPRLAVALDDLKGVFRAPAFDPAALRRTIRLAASDAQIALLAGPLVERLRRDAPGVDLRVSAIGPDIVERMNEGAVDLCFALETTPLPPGAYSERIARDRLALVLRRGHPGANRAWTIADYGAFDHVTVSFFGDGASEIDARLAAAGVTRRIALTTPYFLAALAAVAGGDLVTTLSATFARRFGEAFDLVALEPPFDDIGLEMTLVGTRPSAADPALRWFRAMAREEAGRVFSPADG